MAHLGTAGLVRGRSLRPSGLEPNPFVRGRSLRPAGLEPNPFVRGRSLRPAGLEPNPFVRGRSLRPAGLEPAWEAAVAAPIPANIRVTHNCPWYKSGPKPPRQSMKGLPYRSTRRALMAPSAKTRPRIACCSSSEAKGPIRTW